MTSGESNGDRPGRSTFAQVRAHNRGNRITSISTLPGPAWAAPKYDKAGNMTQFPSPNDPATPVKAKYDAWNRLVECDYGTGRVRYDYDGLHRRIAKHVSPAYEWQESRGFLYSQNWQVLEEHLKSAATNQTWQLACQYVWGLRGPDDLVLRDRFSLGGSPAERLFPLSDDNGNVTHVENNRPGGRSPCRRPA